MKFIQRSFLEPADGSANYICWKKGGLTHSGGKFRMTLYCLTTLWSRTWTLILFQVLVQRVKHTVVVGQSEWSIQQAQLQHRKIAYNYDNCSTHNTDYWLYDIVESVKSLPKMTAELQSVDVTVSIFY